MANLAEGQEGPTPQQQQQQQQQEQQQFKPAAVVVGSSSSQSHGVTESQTWWHCPAGEVARHRNTGPCQSCAAWGEKLGAPRGRQAGGKWVGSGSSFQ